MTLTAIREQCSRPADGVRFTAVCDAEQRGCLLAVHFYLPHSAAHAAAAALLTDLLTASSADYPEPGMITAQLDSLYAADLTAALTVSGDTEDLSFTATWLDDAYALSGEQITENVAELVLGCLRRPHLSGDSPAAFDGTQYAVCLQNLLDDIEGAVNTRRTYALQQAAALAFAGEPAAVPPAGTREAALALTPQSVYAFWQEILQTAPADVIAVMPQEKPQIAETVRRLFAGIRRDVKPVSFVSPGRVHIPPVCGEECLPVSQSRLVMTFRCGEMNRQTANLLTAMLTETGSALLFANVREKAHLCYDISASLCYAKHALTVECGIRAEDAAAAQAAVCEQLRILAEGRYADDLPAAILLHEEAQAAASLDTAGGKAVWLAAAHRQNETRSPAEYFADLRRITRAEIAAAAAEMRLDAVFLLRGTAGEEAECL